MKPLVSVIVPTKNSSATLEACLRSIKEQTYAHIELIVVDNHSEDATREIARRFTDKVFEQGPERSAQRNFGAAKATGEFVLFVDSDMELTHTVVAECVACMEQKKIKGVIIPEESFGEGFWAQCKRLERSFYIGVDAVEAARFFRKTDFDSVGGYNKALVSGEDWDLSDRIELLGSLGRVSALIYHNEGHISLVKTLQKKFYYSQKASAYFSHSSSVKTASKRKQGIFGRYLLFFKRPIKLFKNPLLGFGMLFMKMCEFGFGGVGYLFSSNK